MERKQFSEKYEEELGFCLNMQIIADALEEKFQMEKYLSRDEDLRLHSVRFYRKQQVPQKQFVYIVNGTEVTEYFQNYQHVHFVVIGTCKEEYFSRTSSVAFLDEKATEVDVLEYCLVIFSQYFAWDSALQRALNSDSPIDTMLEVSVDFLQNPIFIHDSDFYILSCPRRVEGMLVWEKDKRTGKYMAPYNVINEFKIDVEYLHTLKTRKPDMFSGKTRDHRTLYVNLWNAEHYEGRICINELQTVFKRSDYYTLEYLAKLVIIASRRRNLFWMSLGKNTEDFFVKVLDGEITDRKEITNMLHFLGWDYEDHYVCLKMGSEHRDFEPFSAVSTFGIIEMQVAASHAFLYHNSITVIANLTVGGNTLNEALSSLAIVLREGLFKMGASEETHDFSNMRSSYRQAEIALEYGSKSDSMIWCHRFDQYALSYLLDQAKSLMPPEYLCAKQILEIAEYDKEHETELNHTLEMYLKLERNVVQTARQLEIHRSTLFYRLDRITQITDIDLENAKTRMYLKLSYKMLK